MNNINYKGFNILIEQKNTSEIRCNYINADKYGNINTSYFNFYNSLLSIDIDDKYFKLSSGYRKKFSNIYKLAFGNKDSLHFNIFDEMESDTAYNDAFEIADILIKNSEITNDNSLYSLSDIRDFLIMLILHIKCSDFNNKTLHGCFEFLIDCKNDNEDDTSKIFEDFINCCHCSTEIHELVKTSSKRFESMNKNMINAIYHKAISLLSVFQSYNLRVISSESDFCIKDFVMSKPKSLYITLSSSDCEIYKPYIKLIVVFFINKIKRLYNLNLKKDNSVMILIDEFQNSISNPLNLFCNGKKHLPYRKINFKDKREIPFIATRENLLKECKRTLKPDSNKRMWYDVPDEMYMQNDDVIFEPLFTSTVPDDEEQEEKENKYNKSCNSDDEEGRRIRRLFKPTDRSSSINKDTDYDKIKNNIEIILHSEVIKKNVLYSKKCKRNK